MAGESDNDVNAATHARIDPVIGAEVSGYKIVARIGNGGMGIVYEGEHALIGKRVAVKVLRHEVADNPDVVQRLIAEARAVNQVGHRGIIDVFGFGTLPDGRQCIVMEFLEGEPLEDVLQTHVRTNRLLPVADVLVILDEILSALSAANSAGVIHRDLKPSNVFLCLQRDGTKFVKLLDFGIAKLGVEAGLQSSIVIGTPTYMAPEQAAKGLVTPALDLYALGVMAFELLTGRPPFIADSPVGLIFMHAKEPPPKLTQFVGDLPVELEELVNQLLAKRPEDRPQNAAVVRLELNRIRKMLPSRPSGVLSVEIQPPRPSQTNLPAVRVSQPSPAPQAATPPSSSTQVLSPRATDAPASAPGPRQSQPRLPPVDASPRQSQPKLAPVSNVPPVDAASPRQSQPRLPPVQPIGAPAASPSLPLAPTDAPPPPVQPARSRLGLFLGAAVLVVGGGIGLVTLRDRADTEHPVAVPPIAIVDAGSATVALEPPPAIDAGPATPVAAAVEDAGLLVGAAPELDAGAKAEVAAVPIDAGAPAPIAKDPIVRDPSKARPPAKPGSIAARIKKLESKLQALAKDPDQNVGIYVTQLKSLSARHLSAKTPADLDAIDLALRRLEADIAEF